MLAREPGEKTERQNGCPTFAGPYAFGPSVPRTNHKKINATRFMIGIKERRVIHPLCPMSCQRRTVREIPYTTSTAYITVKKIIKMNVMVVWSCLPERLRFDFGRVLGSFALLASALAVVRQQLFAVHQKEKQALRKPLCLWV